MRLTLSTLRLLDRDALTDRNGTPVDDVRVHTYNSMGPPGLRDQAYRCRFDRWLIRRLIGRA
jgi:hypothetical protein